ncbi:hypothetical protein CTRI78_v002423 [Colletotrichum trifolii]|uniref:Uncharacterized protein n=1 Tax=Colletotrichum trifolii TaxID=5466 RepID=A0A4V3HX10_COLTR|nr:hypothetical protein CTRI78_v002423 [Colletotrichum trifolii]
MPRLHSRHPGISSNFTPSLESIPESPSQTGNNANHHSAIADVQIPIIFRRARSHTPYIKPGLTSSDLYRIIMDTMQVLEEVDQLQEQLQQAPGPATSLSSSQNQKPATPAEPKQTAEQAETTDPVPESAQAPEPAEPKLDPPGFFTLVSNNSKNTIHHPTVKYIFLDDDPDILTSALADSHAANQMPASYSKSNKLRPPNRAVLLDVVPGESGQWEVSSAASLSADFAVTEASIARQEGEREGGLLLKIEGVDGVTPGDKDKDRAESMPSSSSAVARSGGEEYGPLLEDFEKKMSVLRRVVKAGEARAERAREGMFEEAKGEGKGDGKG